MTFIKEKGRHEAVTSDGKFIHFEDAAEMLACAELRDSLLVLVGREPENAALFMQSSPVGASIARPNKKVIIRIDAEAEFITSSTAEAVPSLAEARSQNDSDVINVIHYRSDAALPQQGRLIEKAFA